VLHCDALLISFGIHVIHGKLFVQTFVITQKILGGHAKTSVTLSLLKIMKYHTTEKKVLNKCETFRGEMSSCY